MSKKNCNIVASHIDMFVNSCQNTTFIHSSGSKTCPLKAFLFYRAKLNPEVEMLWQRPKKKVTKMDVTWYDGVTVGKNSLNDFMLNLSQKVHLSANFTNHCIRAIALTHLDTDGFEARHIMAVSGHKNESTIKSSYSVKCHDNKKRQISNSLSKGQRQPHCSCKKALWAGVNCNTCTERQLPWLCPNQKQCCWFHLGRAFGGVWWRYPLAQWLARTDIPWQRTCSTGKHPTCSCHKRPANQPAEHCVEHQQLSWTPKEQFYELQCHNQLQLLLKVKEKIAVELFKFATEVQIDLQKNIYFEAKVW